jgi:hypothetical protein
MSLYMSLRPRLHACSSLHQAYTRAWIWTGGLGFIYGAKNRKITALLKNNNVLSLSLYGVGYGHGYS